MEVNYIYCLLDPITFERRYIGKARDVKDRYRKHLLPYYLKAETYKNRWLRALLAKGLKPIVMILSEVHSEYDNINDIERFWIRVFKKAGHRLTNATDGGDGGRTRPSKPKVAKTPRTFSWVDACTANTRTWEITKPNGEQQTVVNLKLFCESQGLNPSKMYAVAKGNEGRTHHQGWKCKEIK